MKRLFTLIIAVFFAGASFAQTQIFQEYFADSSAVADYGFVEHDIDGDGNTWSIDVYENEIYMVSNSWDDAALTPNNALFSSAIDLSGYDSVAVEYFIAAASGTYYEEHYKFIVADNNDAASVETAEILLEETLTEAESGATWQKREMSMSQFIGETVFLGWVHYDCTDMYKIMLDSITVTGFGVGINSQAKEKLTLYPNPAQNHIRVNYSGNSEASIEVYSIIGSLVKRVENVRSGDAITVNDLNSGTYLLRIANGSGIQTRQFVVE
ncbi:MAG: T9SS type A sorting domain-containing protein [Salinivirgaceae bacterium]